MKKILLYLLAVSFPLMAQAQKPLDEHVQVKNLSFEKTESGELMIKASIVLDEDFKINTNRGATFTPVLRNGEYTKALPSVIVYGRKREILSRRNQRIPVDAQTVVRRERRKEQVIEYQATTSFQHWMPAAQLVLEADLCGCGNAMEENFERWLAAVPAFTPDIRMNELSAKGLVAAKSAENYKKRIKEGDGRFFFPVNQTTIYPDYLGNPAELKKVQALIEDEDKRYISHITIHAYASPEGRLSHNVWLAEGRAASLKKYLMKQCQFHDSLFSIQSTPEDWDGFRKQVVDSDLPDKAGVLAIIDSNEEPDVKEQQLKDLGDTYTYILREWFPLLRHLNYTIEYAIPEEIETTE